jgi:hypothetical protein
MKIQLRRVTKGSNSAWRLVGRFAVIGLLSATFLSFVQASAFASGGDGLSSTILARTLPGLVPTPLGTENGPVTHSGVGAVGAYIRTWNHRPTNGDAVIIEAFEFSDSPSGAAFLRTLDSGLKGQAGEKGNSEFAVNGIPGGSGVELHTTSSGTPVSEYVVSFLKGNTVFQEIVATTTRDLTAANAVSVASRQFADAHDVPANGANWTVLAVVPFAVLLFGVAMFAIRRRWRHPATLNGFTLYGDTEMGPSVVPLSGAQEFERLPAAPDSTSTMTEWTSSAPNESGVLIPEVSNPR